MLNTVLPVCRKKEYITSILQRIHLHLIVRHNSTKVLFNMNEAFLHHKNDSKTFDFTFQFIQKEFNINRRFNLTRQKSENVETFLRRIDTNLNKVLQRKKNKKNKKNTSTIVEEPVDNVTAGNIVLMKQNSAVEFSVQCEKLLEDPTKLSIVIFGVEYTIKVNPPWIISMKLPNTILSGFPAYPSEFESLFTDKNKSKFIWYKNDNSNKNSTSWKEIGDGFIYIPTNTDIGSKLKLKCKPCNDNYTGPETETESMSTVEAGPGTCPFELRQLFTQEKLSGKHFRITSYNILANTYADSDHSRDVLFPYCPPYALAIDYRKLLFIKELIGYKSDIICLQEVDKKVYMNDMMPALSSLNYEGVYNTKGDMSEGLAIIYDKTRFELLKSQCTIMGENIDSNKIFKTTWNRITNENTLKRFLNRNTSVLIAALRSLDNPTEILVIGNTHLYFHPDADHIRLLQAYYALTACQQTVMEIHEKNPECNTTLLLSGDFNSTPIDGVYELMTKKFISEEHNDWKSNTEEQVEKVSLTHNLSLASACGTPEYTNFTEVFADCLDYIFYESDKLSVSSVVPMPNKNELTTHRAIPSIVFPSDHIAICANMMWKCD